MIEKATDEFLDIGVGKEGGGRGWVIMRCGALGAYLKSRTTKGPTEVIVESMSIKSVNVDLHLVARPNPDQLRMLPSCFQIVLGQPPRRT